jgi:hypothetical protein
MQRLIAHGCTPAVIAATSQSVLEEIIKPVGFYRMKAGPHISIINLYLITIQTISYLQAGYLRSVAAILLEKYSGDIPDTVEGLVALPGVGPKMAFIVSTPHPDILHCFILVAPSTGHARGVGPARGHRRRHTRAPHRQPTGLGGYCGPRSYAQGVGELAAP